VSIHTETERGSYYSELHDAAPSISPGEWAYFHLVDTISDQIAAFMESEGITQAELARRMDVKPSFVSRVLAGDANPTLKTLAAIFYHLDTKLEARLVSANALDVKWFAVRTNDVPVVNDGLKLKIQSRSRQLLATNISRNWLDMMAA